jgi:hypothetical protein
LGQGLTVLSSNTSLAKKKRKKERSQELTVWIPHCFKVWTRNSGNARSAEGTRRGRQQLFRETKKLIRKPSKKPSQEDKPQPHWQLPCSCAPLSEWELWYTSQEQVWFQNERGSFLPGRWWKFADGHIAIPESLTPTFVKQFQEGTHWLRADSSWDDLDPSIFMSPSFLTYVRGTVCVPKNNPRQGPRAPP